MTGKLLEIEKEVLNTSEVPFSYLLNASALPIVGEQIFDEIYDKAGNNESTRLERLQQIGSWLGDHDLLSSEESSRVEIKSPPFITKKFLKDHEARVDKLAAASALQQPLHTSESSKPDHSEYANDDYDDDSGLPSGTTKTPPCAQHGRYYCSYNEDYPIKVVTEVARYYKWPLEKLFRDLRQQVMPKLANDNYGGLVCDSITRVVRPGWARNTNNRWLVVINTDHYQQFVSEVICRHGSGTYCNFVPPCYHATCQQRYNTQKLLVIDPWNPYKGPFLAEFLFPSCCICYVPESHDSFSHSASTKNNLIKRSNDDDQNPKVEL
ncbi:uncharacterized protein B4U79_04425 [Dinothrombium tinctorium]|uniref:Spaetzle domain-containing protein n=1 Tax=Dinothrombium tinctorium TaxID=1965070 RepID=A0A3S3Q0W6_9ACAR|nr:uncharacterized protein B4U79_01532 [Dinothrombium tinctorium]RWS10163.1 uncharacterized protein B4U79_10921 [Dinothrombium tinctorium]RWS11812.1 uncharacterized protein B4U79_12078 [Dinothrombium tinctorium]RWS12058.1 uncharacterized protein B4U79_04425 [Dinothrombium tinctorium]